MKKTSSTKDSKQQEKKKNSIETFAINQNLTIDEIQEKFPKLYAELTNKKMSMNIDEVKDTTLSSSSREEKFDQDPFNNYDPDVYDFLSRARTNEEGFEIINFLARQGQLSSEMEKELIEKLETLGIRHFGPLRSSNYYFKKSEEIRTRNLIQKRYPSQINDETKG